MHIITGVHQVEAEVAAGRLRSAGINAHVVRDNEALLGVAGSSSLGTFSVAIADSDAVEARGVLNLRPAPAGETAVGRDQPGVFAAIARRLGRTLRK
jgi:hypothetical protein